MDKVKKVDKNGVNNLQQQQQQYTHNDNYFVAKNKNENEFVDDLSRYNSQVDQEGEDVGQALKRANMSKTERDFLMRRGAPAIETNNIMMSATEPNFKDNPVNNSNKKPQFPNPVMHQSLDNIPGFGQNRFPVGSKYGQNGGGGGGGGANSEVLNAMRHQIDEKEKQIQTLHRKAKAAEEAALHASARAKEANKKLATQQSKWVRSMQEKDDEHSRALLEVSEREERVDEFKTCKPATSTAKTTPFF